jgi:hypothetical protein
MVNINDQANFTVVFRTGKSWEYEMVLNTLEENDIPYQSWEESSSGVRLAMPLRPTPGPGIWWAVLVPAKFLKETQSLLSELPIEIKTDPDVWDFSSSTAVKIGWQIYVWIILGFTVLWAILNIIKTE